MKYYPYSVKDTLLSHFGHDAVDSIRRPHDTWLDAEEKKHLLPLAWQYADTKTVKLFLDSRFLLDTVLEDDYMAYIYQEEEKKCVLLMFMLFEADAPFKMDIQYALSIVSKWQDAGYEAKILSQCVEIEESGRSDGFRFTSHLSAGHGASIYKLTNDSGNPLLVFESHRCWQHYKNKVVHVSTQNDLREFECLFSPNVSLTRDPHKTRREHSFREQRETVAEGIEAVKEFLNENTPVRVCYSEFENSGVYSKTLLAGSKEISLGVSFNNLIAEVHYAEADCNHLLPCKIPCFEHSLLEQVPQLLRVRPLDIPQMHGYVLQLTYADDSVRNYYLHMFHDIQVPTSVEIDGVLFNEELLKSAVIRENGVCFENGCCIPAHLLFYRSYPQLQLPKVGEKHYDVPGGILQLKYTLPPKEFKSHFVVERYWGTPSECYGPADAFIDENGRRTSDIAFYKQSMGKWRGKEVRTVAIEPTGRFGFIKEDRSWLLPPVYTTVGSCEGEGARAARIVDGAEKKFLITPKGEEIEFPFRIDIRDFYNNLCPFDAAEGTVSAPNPGYYWDYDYDEVTAGNWGFVNSEGQIVVEPQYVYVAGFSNGGGTHSVVARLVDEKLFWGAIDSSGNEIIPCVYESLYTRWGDAFAFRRFGESLYGIMDLDGNILVNPKFDYFEEYNEKHRMLTVSEQGSALRVYSMDRQEMILPAEYDFDCVDYGETIISCELQDTCKDLYFDYSGKELDFSEYDFVHESEGMICVVKGQKQGYITLDGTEIVPTILPVGFGDDALKLYRRGYILTESNKLYGLSSVSGERVLPQKFAEITPHEQFVIASERTDGNWCVRDTLYGYDGKPIMEGPYRHMCFDEEQQELTVETPWGTEYYQLIKT